MKNKKLFFIIATTIWTGVILSFSLQPGEVSGDLSGSVLESLLGFFMPGVLDNLEQLELFHLILRKCAHFTEFMILGVLGRTTLQYMELRYKGVCGLGFCVAVATIDETLQLFVSGRAGRVQDVMIDSAGALVGIVIVFVWVKLLKCRLKEKNNRIL